uniref:Uncharacterized protein n=1 Tax=Anguilla anguilla TaxID=7936 RepID=A0A0E9V489_ANGAN
MTTKLDKLCKQKYSKVIRTDGCGLEPSSQLKRSPQA